MTEQATPESDRPPQHRLVVAGASAGGVEALATLVSTLPRDFPHALIVVLHVSPSGTSVLPQILARVSSLPVRHVRDEDPLLPGRVYVAPPDFHVMVQDSMVRLTQTPRENGHRPAIDPTMCSAADTFGTRTVGIVLSGARDDGTAGLLAIKARGGLALAQDPSEALTQNMPRSAIQHVDLDAVLRLGEMIPWILAADGGGPAEGGELRMVHSDAGDNSLPVNDAPAEERIRHPGGDGTRFTCPDCGGVLFERKEGSLDRFECSVGHVFSIESLSNAQAEALETALWAAIRSLEDRAAMLHRLGAHARANAHARSAAHFGSQATVALERASLIRQAVQRVPEEESAA